MKKTMIIPVACIAALVILMTFSGNAQPLSSQDIKTQMLKDWERAKTYTVDYLNTMPAEKYSFKAVDSLRSFAQQMLHLAQGNLFLMSMASTEAPPSFMMRDLEHSPGAQKKDSVMYYITTSYDYGINTIRNCDVATWGEKKKARTFEETKWAFMMKAFEHQGHHRGQTTIYIRLQGIRPPEERLF